MQYFEDLGYNIKIYQDDELYKFTSDSILLSRFARVKYNDMVADFCSGSGIVGFHLYALNKDKINSLTFFEMQKPLADLSVKSIAENNLTDKFFAVNTKLQDIENSYAEKFSLIVCNPPYMPIGHGEKDKRDNIAVCRTELELSLTELITAISKCLKFGGRTCIVHRADRLTDLMCAMREKGIEPKRLQTVCPLNKDAPYLVMVEGVKGGKSGLDILPAINN